MGRIGIIRKEFLRGSPPIDGSLATNPPAVLYFEKGKAPQRIEGDSARRIHESWGILSAENLPEFGIDSAPDSLRKIDHSPVLDGKGVAVAWADPVKVYLETHSRCNMGAFVRKAHEDLERSGCTYCLAKYSPNGASGLSEGDLDIILPQIVDSGVPALKVGGGEPTLYRHLGKILRVTRENGIHAGIPTNGTTFRGAQGERRFREIASLADRLTFSYDGESATERTRAPGVSEIVTDALLAASRYARENGGIELAIAYTLGPENMNLNDARTAVELAKRASQIAGFQVPLKVRTVKPSGGAKGIVISPTKDYQNVVEYFSSQDGCDLEGRMLPPGSRPLPATTHSVYTCGAATGSIGISPSGVFMPCPFDEGTANGGTLLGDTAKTLSELWCSMTGPTGYLRSLSLAEECSSCENLPSCHSWCPAQKSAQGLSSVDVDPLCPKAVYGK